MARAARQPISPRTRAPSKQMGLGSRQEAAAIDSCPSGRRCQGPPILIQEASPTAAESRPTAFSTASSSSPSSRQALARGEVDTVELLRRSFGLGPIKTLGLVAASSARALKAMMRSWLFLTIGNGRAGGRKRTAMACGCCWALQGNPPSRPRSPLVSGVDEESASAACPSSLAPADTGNSSSDRLSGQPRRSA